MDLKTGSLISSILKSPVLSKPSLELSIGQIVRGQIMQRLPEQQALVKIQNLTVLAKMDTELSVGDLAWLQVQQIGEPTLLKVLPARNPKTEKSLSDLTKSLGLDDSKDTLTIVNRLVEEKLPVQKSDINQMKQLLQKGDVSLDTILFAYKKGFPLTDDILGSLEQFFNGIADPETNAQLEDVLTNLSTLAEHVGDDAEGMKAVTKALSVFHAQDQLSGVDLQNYLKIVDQLNLLLTKHMEKEPDSHSREKLEQIVRFITGQQLLLSPTQTPIQQWLIYLPLPGLNQSFVQVESQKQPNGQIDPDNCHILFCLDLEKLGHLTVDLFITKRIVSLDFRGGHPDLSPLSQIFRDDLTNGLKDLGYHLSNFRTSNDPLIDIVKNPRSLGKSYKGVDLRI